MSKCASYIIKTRPLDMPRTAKKRPFLCLIKFVCCDMPEATRETIGIFGVLARWEREQISKRTKEALNEEGIPSRFGGRWHKTSVLRVADRNDLNNFGQRKKTGILLKGGGVIIAGGGSPSCW